MAESKEQLDLLFNFVKEICYKTGNRDFTNRLRDFLQSNFPDSDNSKISEIYELCLARNLQKQAEAFYSHFPIEEIKADLINDFISMENHRRMGEFEEFGLALFQQIERVTNHLAKDTRFDEIARKMMLQPAFRRHGAEESPEAKFQREKTTVADLLFVNYLKYDNTRNKPNIKISSHYIMDKISCVYYFFGEKGYLYNSFDFRTVISKIKEIYQIRNLVHRGGEVLYDSQQQILDKILPEKEMYYVDFIGVLNIFMKKIAAGYPLSVELLKYSACIK